MPKAAQVSSNYKISSKKNVINGIRNTVLWNKNTTNYRTHSTANNRKKTYKRGANEAPRTKRNYQR